MSVRKRKKKNLITLKMQQRSGDLYENKGPNFDGPLQSRNVVENKDS
jgi:hypothetical protein